MKMGVRAQLLAAVSLTGADDPAGRLLDGSAAGPRLPADPPSQLCLSGVDYIAVWPHGAR